MFDVIYLMFDLKKKKKIESYKNYIKIMNISCLKPNRSLI